MIDVGPALSAIDNALRSFATKARPLNMTNFMGDECTTVAELAATNRKSELGAAAFVMEHKSLVPSELFEDAQRFITAEKKALSPGPESNHDGVAVVVTFEADERAQVAIAGGEPPDELHITLGYFGDQNRFGFVDELRGIVDVMARTFRAFPVTLGGVTRFSTEDPNSPDALVLNADAPLLNHMNHVLMARCAEQGFGSASEHGYTPHCTIGYLNTEDDMPIQRWAPMHILVTKIELWTDEHYAAPLIPIGRGVV